MTMEASKGEREKRAELGELEEKFFHARSGFEVVGNGKLEGRKLVFNLSF